MALLVRSRYAGNRVVLVCDGTPPREAPQGRWGHAEVVYAGSDRTADEVIASITAGSTAPRELTVVSSDREVSRQARRRRCRTLDSEAFLRQLIDDAARQEKRPASQDRPSGKLSGRQVKQWMAAFGVDPENPVPDAPLEVPPELDADPEAAPDVAGSDHGSSDKTPDHQAPETSSRLPEDLLNEARRIWEEGQA